MSKLLLLALACLFVSTQALSLTQVPIGTTPWSVSHVSTTYTYGAQDDITVFTYSVTAGSGADALSHFVIGVSPAPASATLISDDISSDFQDFTSIADPATGLKGYLYPIGSESGTTTFNLKFKGKVNWKHEGTYGVKGHQLKYSVVPNSIVVPDFAVGSDDWDAGNAPFSVPADVEVPCSNTNATAKPAAALVQQVDTTGSHCPAEKVLLNVYERTLDDINKIYSRQIQRVSVKDNTPPEFIEPANFTSYIQLTCTDVIPPLPGVTAQDDCDTTPILQPPCAEQRANGTCPTNYFLRRTWTATDHCGNSKCKTQTIAVIDNKAPILIGVPNNTVIECNPSVPVADPPTVNATDECNCFTYPPNSNNPVSYTQQTRPGECNNTLDIIRTWSATDCCGNHVSANQIIVIEDTTPPFINFTTSNSSGTFECDSVPAFPTAYAYDICMLYLPTIYVNQTITNSTRCPKQDYTITRVYYTIDDCGNYNSTTSVYDVLDRTPPQWNISSLPLNETRECGHVPEPENPTATDNCGKHDVIRLPDTRENSSCPNEYIIYRHWTVIDDCGNYNNYTQQVTVVDTTPTYIKPSSIPQFGPYQCAFEVPALDLANDINGLQPEACGANQDCACDTSFIKNYTESRVNGTCVNKFNVTRYYTFTDCSGNNDTKPSTFTVSDTLAPVLTGPPNTTNECSAIDPIGTPTSEDTCDGTTLPIYYSNYNITGDCAGNFTVVRIWNVTDVCSNQATHTQFIKVQDTKAPVYSYVPGPISAVCSPPAKERLNASDLCSGVTVFNDLPSVESNRKCQSNYTLTHYWAAKDGCGHWNNVSQPVTVYDNVPPTLSGVPQDQNVSCDAIPIPASVCAVDNCIGVNISFTEVRVNYTCNADGFYYTLTRTWTATDDCGNTASASQRVNVFNRYTPQFFPATQANLNQTCESVSLPAAPTANNSCSAATVTPYHFRVNGSCPDSYVLYRNFRALDSPCQNANWLNYTITVTDTKAPNFTFVPADVTAQCTPPNPTSPTASDKCDATPTIGAARDTIISYTCPHIYVVNRTWNATDDCGNFAFAYQIINVTNPNFPVWGVPMPANITGLQSCVAPEPPTVNATASCGERVNITYTQIRINGSCEYNYTLIRTWVAVDECFHTISHTQSITLFDAVPPTVSPVTSYIESYCSAPAIPDVCVSDNCNGVRLQFNETEPERRCNNNRTLVRVWVGIDECGNKNSVQQIVVINDTVAPVFDPATPPNDYSVNCSLPSLTNPTASDACGGQVDLKDFSWRENGTCPHDWYWHVAWRAVDNCSNTAWWNYTIHVISETTPTVTWNPAPPQDGNFTCATPPGAPVPTVHALCFDGDYEFHEVRVNGSCTDRFNLSRTWTIKDSCGNHNFNVTQFLWGVHTINPTIDRPANDTATCESPAVLPTPEVRDMCQRPFTPDFFNSTQDYSCHDTFLERREWNYTDECGLSVSTVQWVQHTDNNAPDLTTPTPKSEHNLCYVIYPNATDASVTDECDSAPLQNVSTTIQNVECYYIFDVVNNFTTTDRCHNFDWKTVTNHYSWDKKPEFELPSNWDANPKYPCNDVKVAPVITAKDGCGKNLSVIFKEVRINGTCPNEYTLVRTWNVSDNCSIPNSLVQTVTVEDKSWPTFCNMPEHMNVQCGLVPPVADVTITDNCPGLTVTFNETKVNVTNCCNYELLRTWTATDACGHVEVYTQHITVYDHEPLEFFGIPPDVKCNDEGNCPYEFKAANVTARKAPLARGFCVKDPVSREASGGASSSQVTLYFGGNPVVYNVVGGTVVTFVDKTAELNLELDSGSSKLNITVAVTEGVNITSLGGYSVTNPMTTAHPDTSNPLFWLFYKKLSGVMVGSSGSRPLSFDSAPIYSQLGVGANGFNQRYGFTLSFKYSDGATAHTASIPIDMNKDGVDGCYFAPDALPKYENCNCSYPVNLTIFRTNDTCEQDYILEARYCAADENSAVYCLSQFIEVCDLAPPTISNLFLNQTTGYCTDPYPAWTLNATDTCDAYPSIGHNDSRRNGTCEWRYTIERRVGAIDACGNVQPLYIEYHFDDMVDPVVTVSPHGANDIFECDNIPTPPTASVTDVCGVDTSMYPTTNLTNTSIPNPGTGATCKFSYRQDYLYEAYDVCTNYDSDSYSRKIQDTKIPAIYNIKENELKQCKATYVVASPTANDTCSGDLTSQIVVTNRTWNSNCPNIYNVTFYFNVKDDCLNEAVERTWNISYYDDVPPTFDQNPLPGNAVENCHNVSTPATLTASDTCNYAWVNFTQVRVNGSCDNSYLLIRTWVATDCAGNKAFHQQNVTVVDVTAPVISPRPTTTVAACVPAPSRPSFCASDNCDGVTLDFSEERVQTDPDHQSWTCARYFLNRTVQAVDECGNRDTVNYLVYVNDTVAPNCSSNTFSANISCEHDAPGDGYTITPPSCSDDCQASTGVNPNVTLFQWSEAGPQNCNGSRIHHYDYFVTDNCGNFVWHNSTINVEDKTAPRLHNVPASQNLQCLANLPVDTTTKSDNCDPNVYINKTVVRTNSSCPNIYNVSITWFPVDECRNVGETNTSLFVYYDDVVPFWTTNPMPQNGTVVCDSVPATPVVAASDDCSGTSFVTVNYRNWTELDERNCNNSYYLYREWVATDCSGNSIRHVQTLHVIDNVTATISSLPDDKEYFCKSVPPPVAVCASDNCPGVKLSYVSTSTSNASRPTCNDQYVINRTYSAVDNCGNVFTDSYFLVVNDQIPPNCTTNDPKNATCETPAINDPNAPDCGEDCSSVNKYPHHFTDYNGPQNCNSSYIKHFNWLIEDDCGNFVWRNSTVLVYDYTVPTLTNPPSDNNTAECHDVPPTPEVASNDNCRKEQVTIAYSNTSSRIDGACQNYDIVRTWLVTDECGNENTYHQIVNVTDTRKPFWTGVFPPNNGNNYTYECSDSFTVPVLTAADLCGNVTVVFTAQNVSFPDQQCQNSYATNWTWVATDKCGNSISYTTFLFVNDTIKPTLSEPEGGNRDVQCTDVPKPPAMCCGDNCNGVHVEYIQTRVNSTKCDYEYQLIRNWTCIDACGNFDTKIQVINVSDHAYPKWISTLPEDEFFECVMGDEQDVLSANDTCSTVNVTKWYTNSSRGCDHNYTVVRYWTAMDECGNLISYNQTVDIRDTQPPWTNTSGLLCYTPEASATSGATDDVIVIPDFTNVNAFFKGADACSSVQIDFNVAYDCTSDQDDLYGVGCTYNATTNTLTISMVRSPDRPQGRLYTLTARVVDQCGHQVPTSRQIFVPRDSSSGSYRNFTGDDAITVATCTVLHSVCPDQCGCQTVDTACAQSTSFGTPLAFFSNFDSVTDTTVLRYVANANNTNRIIIGIDFSEVNLVSWTPDTGVVVGPQVGTYVSGISFQPTAANCEDALSGCPLIALPEVTITIRGNFATGAARQVPFQVGGEGLGQDTNIYSANNSACSDASGLLNLVAGPSDASHVTYAGTNDLTGHVYLSGWRDGFDRSLQYGVADVLVALYEAFDGSSNAYVDNIITSTLPTPIAYALTDSTGAYVFPGLPKTADKYLVKIQRDALLAATPRSSGHFLTDPVYSQSTYPAYYPADPAKFHGFARLATNPDFKLVFDDENKPEYLRHYASQVFEGNAKVPQYWSFLTQNLRTTYPVDTVLLNAYKTYVASKLNVGSCVYLTGNTENFPASNLDAFAPFEIQLKALAYNLASGRGPFEPYRLVAEWTLEYARHIYCNRNTAPAQDLALAHNWVKLMNSADDDDRPSPKPVIPSPL